LIDNSACSDVQVSDFGVPHLSVGESDVFAGAKEFRVGTCGEELFIVWSVAVVNEVALGFVADTSSVEDY